MSDDLISREALMKGIQSFRCSLTGLSEGKGAAVRVADEYRNSILQIIEDQPAAFDKEKVLAEMRNEYADAISMYIRDKGTAHSFSSEIRKDTWGKGIEIVEKGGIG